MDSSTIKASATTFLGLPVELRTRIYEAHYEEQRVIRLPPRYDGPGPWNNQQPLITRVSRQVRAESLPIFYNFCTYEVEDICGLCRLARDKKADSEPKLDPDKACQCIPHRCIRKGVCQAQYRRQQPWAWILAIGDHNLAHIKTVTLTQRGNDLHGHVGYSIILHQDLQTKALTISQDSFWQEDKRRFPYKIAASEPEGKLIVRDTMRLLDQHDSANRGLTADNIERILRHADARSFHLKRGVEDIIAHQDHVLETS